MDNVKQEMAKNKEMKESLKKFREEREKLEQSDALRKARYFLKLLCMSFFLMVSFAYLINCPIVIQAKI